MPLATERIGLEQVTAAAHATRPFVRRTPLERSEPLSALAGYDVYLKLEDLQHTGAFKLRGALTKLLALDASSRARGVLTASAGDHGQGLAHAARLLGVPAWVVLPESVPLAKLVAIQRSGAEAILAGADYDEAHAIALRTAAQKGALYVHAFDDPEVIAGQGTVALEMLEDEPSLDAIVVPVGGGGLLAGCGLVTSARGVRLVGAQSEGAPAFAHGRARGGAHQHPSRRHPSPRPVHRARPRRPRCHRRHSRPRARAERAAACARRRVPRGRAARYRTGGGLAARAEPLPPATAARRP